MPETEVRDIRQAAVPDAGEHADPDQRRRVPPVDDTTATVDRAHLASVEIANRQPLDEAADRDPEPDDAARLDDLARWSADDHHADDAEETATDGDAAEPDDVLQR